MKMHWAVRTLLGPGRGPQGDPRLVLKAVQGAISYTVSLVRSRCVDWLGWRDGGWWGRVFRRKSCRGIKHSKVKTAGNLT
jgi:hypothetical protein